MIDHGQQNLAIHQQAQSLATLVHAITLTSLHLPGHKALSLRRNSRILFEKLVELSERQATEPDRAQVLDEASAIASMILSDLSSPDTHSSIAEEERADLVASYTHLLNSLHSPTGSSQPSSFGSDRMIEKEPAGSGHQRVSQSLRGKVILITRPLSQSQVSVRMVERLGGLPVVVPMIEIVDPDDWYPVDRSIINLKGYDGVIFTSQSGVERFLGRISSVNPMALKVLATRRIYAVGEKTRASLENAQIPVTLMPEKFSAKELLSVLQTEPLAGKRFLFPRGSLAKDEIPGALRSSDAVVDEVEVYRTVETTGASSGALNAAFKNDEIDAVAFFSPSAVQNFAKGVDLDHTRESVIACIGRSTAEAAESAGFAKIMTAPEATAESLIGALVRYFVDKSAVHPGH